MSKFIPNSFQVPNAVIDELMDDLKDVEFRCYLTLIRQTTGWNKQFDFISVSQFQKFTGRGKTAIIAAMQNLQKLGLVLELEQTKNGVKCYELNMDKLAEWGSESEPQEVQKVNGSKSEPVQKVNRGGSESELEAVQKVNTQNTNNKTHSTKDNNCDGVCTAIATDEHVEVLDDENTNQAKLTDKTNRANPNNVATWNAYAKAYRNRYGVLPESNAKVRGQIAQFVKYVGAEKAPKLAEYYVWHNDNWFVKCRHDLGNLLKFYQQIATDYSRNEQMTAQKARQEESTQNNFDNMAAALAARKARRAAQ